jgi:dTDP-4-dehydrorhamnose 3,5-epimerase
MIFRETQLKGAFIVEMEPIGDNRGFFARTWCQKEFEAHGLISCFVQNNITFSPKRGTLRGTELTADNRRMTYIPGGFAHGYQILMDETEVFYQVGAFYAPEYERGIRWDDRAFAIDWPINGPLILSEKDRRWPDYARENCQK